MPITVIKGREKVKPNGPRVIAVTSGKGGVGKTNFTVNLAMALSAAGQRVIIFDADLGLANVEVLLGISPQYTLYDFLFNGKSLAEILISGPQNIQIISGGSGMLELANLPGEAITRLRNSINSIEGNVDIVLVDTGAGINKNVLAFVAAAQEVILVVTPEPTSITDGYSMIKVLSMYDVHNTVKVLINRSGKKQEADDTVQKLQLTAKHFLPNVNIEYLGNVPEDVDVVKAVKNQQSFYCRYPHCLASEAINEVAKKLMGIKEKKSAGLTGFINRLTCLFR